MTKDVAADARVPAVVPRAHFNELAAEGNMRRLARGVRARPRQGHGLRPDPPADRERRRAPGGALAHAQGAPVEPFGVSEREPPIGPLDALRIPRYAGLRTFARLPTLERRGPRRRRRARRAVRRRRRRSGPARASGRRRSARRRCCCAPTTSRSDVSPFAERAGGRRGRRAPRPGRHRARRTPRSSRRRGRAAPRRARVLGLGGDHSVALPLVRAPRPAPRAARRCSSSTPTPTRGTRTSARR